MLIYLMLTAVTLTAALMVKGCYEKGRPLVSGDYNYIYSGITRERLKSICGMIAIFILLTGVSAIRLNVGNDYSKYVEFMHRFVSGAVVPTEPGFNYLTWFIYTISGFENYVAVFAVFAAATMFFFLAAIYRQTEDFWMSFMMFMLLGYYFQSISTVRYYLALGIALYSIEYCMKGDWPRFVILIMLGALFHKSLLVVLVLYPLASIRWKKWMMGGIALMCISCLFLKDFYLKVAIKIYPSYAGTEYLSGGTSKTSILRCAGVLILAFLILRGDVLSDKKLRFYFYSNLMALCLYTFGSFLPTVSRIAYYLTVTQILYVPALILRVDDSILKKIGGRNVLKIITFAGCGLYFFMYMRHAADDGVRILPYETFFFHELPATLSERGFG